jgi:hypothetical protein
MARAIIEAVNARPMARPTRNRDEREKVLTKHWRQIPPGDEGEPEATVKT